jgi:hypothetical protein
MSRTGQNSGDGGPRGALGRQIDVRNAGFHRFLGVVIALTSWGGARMSAVAAIAVFPILTLLLIGLSKAENVITRSTPVVADRVPADPPSIGEISSE